MADYSLVPVDYQPDFGNVSLVPVDYDPFAGDGVQPGPQAQTAQVQVQTQPAPQAQQALGQQVQTRQPTMGASQSSAPTPGVGTTNALTAGTSDFFRSIPRGIVSGFNNAASALGRATQAEMGQDVDAPTPAQGMEILEKNVTGPMHRPEGRSGKFGASIGEFLGNPTSYLVPGSLPLKVGTAALGGLGSEAGGQLGEGTPLEAPFRFAGGALGALSAARLGTAAHSAASAPRVSPVNIDEVARLPPDTLSIAEQSAASVADKLDRYLLNPDHVDGGADKAKWFKQALGFHRGNAADLAKQLVFDESQAVQKKVSEHGTVMNQTINVTGANGRTIPIVTGWTIKPDGVPRLNTAFPE